jgi:2-polyprenyl-3-methyl-5-hydroxy-6-metoxy-1,4-benzoquinol methylase
MNVLELGYGDGIITRALIEGGMKPTVVEGARELYEQIGARHGGRATAVHGMFEDYSALVMFDAVIASHVLEHVADPVTVLRRIAGWLKPDGRLLVIVPNRESLHRRLAVLMGLQPELDTLSARDLLVGHRRVYSLATLENELVAGGFRVVERRGFFLKPLANSQMLGFAPELLHALNGIAPQLEPELLANIGVVAVRA